MAERLIVLFGGSGFVGRHLASRLATHGWAVQVASRHPRQEEAFAAAVRVVTVAADLGAEDQVRRAVTGAEAVINLVGIAREQDASFEAVHVAGAARLARLAAAAGVKRLLHLSALGIAEDAPSMVDRTKARGETAVRAAFPAATLVRPSLIDGPGDHFFTRFAAMAKMSPVLPIIGGGRTRFQPLHIELSALAHRGCGANLGEAARAAGDGGRDLGPGRAGDRHLACASRAAAGGAGPAAAVPAAAVPAGGGARGRLERLPDPPLTCEEVRLLRTDKVASGLPTPAVLGIAARRLDQGLPASLHVDR